MTEYFESRKSLVPGWLRLYSARTRRIFPQHGAARIDDRDTCFHDRPHALLVLSLYSGQAPPEDPVIAVDKLRYSAGERIRANCTARSSYPAANITWFVNGHRGTGEDGSGNDPALATTVNHDQIPFEFSALDNLSPAAGKTCSKNQKGLSLKSVHHSRPSSTLGSRESSRSAGTLVDPLDLPRPTRQYRIPGAGQPCRILFLVYRKSSALVHSATEADGKELSFLPLVQHYPQQAHSLRINESYVGFSGIGSFLILKLTIRRPCAERKCTTVLTKPTPPHPITHYFLEVDEDLRQTLPVRRMYRRRPHRQRAALSSPCHTIRVARVRLHTPLLGADLRRGGRMERRLRLLNSPLPQCTRFVDVETRRGKHVPRTRGNNKNMRPSWAMNLSLFRSET
uniref:Ig-like domain-containing protein n=1 Tax=Timema shepardi TaxID=629360 RepID=A0A7R9AP38_TIMSH|nr:unnamed protein product [Timema shepardi]